MEEGSRRLKHYQKYVRKYWVPFSLAVLFLTIEAICDLLQPTIMALVIDNGVAQGDLQYVFKMGGLMLAITLVGAMGAVTRSILATYVSQRFGAELRFDLYEKIQRLTFTDMDRFDKASLVTRLTNDISQVQLFVNGMMRIFVKAPLLCIGSLIMAIRLDFKLSIILFVTVPIVSLLIYLNMKLGFPRFTRVQQAIDRVNGRIREYLGGVRVVKAFNRFDYEVEKFADVNEQLKTRSIQAMRLMAVFSPLIALTLNMGIIFALWYGGHRVDDGTLQVGVIVAFINYMTQILFSLMMISMVFNMFIRAKASASRISEVLAVESTVNQHESNEQDIKVEEKGSIQFDNVSFAYANGIQVLEEISFYCKGGTTIGIIGATGSGKSTLVRLIPRFYEATMGTIRVGGIDVTRWDENELRKRIAIVPQKTTLFTGTILENIRFGNDDATFEDIQAAARMAEADAFIQTFPEGYETVLGQGGINLSGGQKQRIAIARALVRQPEILILDDSTSAVDVITESRIKQSLRENTKHLTTIIIAQRISSIIDADWILVLDQGRLVGQGTHNSLMESCSVYQDIYRSQMGQEVLVDVETT